MSFKLFRACVLLVLVFSSVLIATAQGPDVTADFQPIDEPVLALGVEDEWDSVSIRFPYVIFHEGLYHLYYTAYTNSTTPQAIGYATSEDGVTWTRYTDNPVFEASGEGFDAFSVSSPVVVVENDTWVMYYNGQPTPGNPPFGKGIGRATAPSPTGPWTRSETPVLEAGSLRRWDGAFIFPEAVFNTDEGYVMYYSGQGTGQGMVGMATSPDGLTWIKYDDPATTDRPFDESDPVFMTGERGAWDDQLAWGSSIQRTENGWEMVYSGGTQALSGPFVIGVGYAYSEDGINWTRYADNPIVLIEDNLTLFPALVTTESDYLVYYGLAPAGGGSKTEIHLATGTITFAD